MENHRPSKFSQGDDCLVQKKNPDRVEWHKVDPDHDLMKKYKPSASSDTAEIFSEEYLDNWSSVIFICKIFKPLRVINCIHLSYEFFY